MALGQLYKPRGLAREAIGCFNETTKDSDLCGIHKYIKP